MVVMAMRMQAVNLLTPSSNCVAAPTVVRAHPCSYPAAPPPAVQRVWGHAPAASAAARVVAVRVRLLLLLLVHLGAGLAPTVTVVLCQLRAGRLLPLAALEGSQSQKSHLCRPRPRPQA